MFEDNGTRQRHPQLKQLVAEASRALALLDADRLEELALSCQALNRELASQGFQDRPQIAAQAREAAGEMAVLIRVLESTRSNLDVMCQLRELRSGRLEYTAPQSPRWAAPGRPNGDD